MISRLRTSFQAACAGALLRAPIGLHSPTSSVCPRSVGLDPGTCHRLD